MILSVSLFFFLLLCHVISLLFQHVCSRTSNKTACGWWVILGKYVLIYWIKQYTNCWNIAMTSCTTDPSWGDAAMMTSSNGNIFRVTGPLCGEFTGPGEFPTQRPVTQSFDVFFDLRLNKRLSKQPWGWWFETPSWSLWRHRNDWWPVKCGKSVHVVPSSHVFGPGLKKDMLSH